MLFPSRAHSVVSILKHNISESRPVLSHTSEKSENIAYPVDANWKMKRFTLGGVLIQVSR